jgi:hypothetical protein
MKSNFARVALRVQQSVDSRVVLDENGAETLLGKGDLLFKSPDMGLVRLQGYAASGPYSFPSARRVSQTAWPAQPEEDDASHGASGREVRESEAAQAEEDDSARPTSGGEVREPAHVRPQKDEAPSEVRSARRLPQRAKSRGTSSATALNALVNIVVQLAPSAAVANAWYDSESAPTSRKEKMLRHSLELAQSEHQNEEALYTVFDKALDARLYALAEEAIRNFSRRHEADSWICLAVYVMFREWRTWEDVTGAFAGHCARRVLEARGEISLTDEAGVKVQDRSRALAYLGLYYLRWGDHAMAEQLWTAASRYDVDRAIKGLALAAVRGNNDNVDKAMMLIEAIKTKTVKSSALSEISEYA